MRHSSTNTVTAGFVGIPVNRTLLYAKSEEFCAIFDRDMQSLFTLALLLTGSESKAEQCFLLALEKCRRSTTVFRDWATSWARVATIENAIEMIAPTPAASDRGESVNDLSGDVLPELDLILRLNAFERFVYVLTVLDRFTVQDSSILLKCNAKDVERAQLKAFAFIGLHSAVVTSNSNAVEYRLAS